MCLEKEKIQNQKRNKKGRYEEAGRELIKISSRDLHRRYVFAYVVMNAFKLGIVDNSKGNGKLKDFHSEYKYFNFAYLE